MKNKVNKSLSYLAMASFSIFAIACADDDDGGNNGGMNTSQLYVSSNTAGQIRTLDVLDVNNVEGKTITVPYVDADGIAYDEVNDRVIQFDRSGSTLNAYNQFSTLNDNANIAPSFSLQTVIGNGRELTMRGATVVVADDQDGGINQLHVFTVGADNFTQDRVYIVDFNVWGIQLVGNTLYAIVDNSDQLAVFNNFGDAASGELAPDKTVSIEGIVRTHGLQFVESRDIMVLTDVGSGTVDDDGALRIIEGFSGKLNATADGESIALSDQIDISGPATLLGNPVDVVFDVNSNRVYTAERANGGGRILGFNLPSANSEAAPNFSEEFAGASAIFIQN